MTATIPDAALILRREDERLARRAGDDPLPAETITALADAVRRQIIDPILADTTPDTPANADVDWIAQQRAALWEIAKGLARHLHSAKVALGDSSLLDMAERDAAEARAEIKRLRGELEAVLAENTQLADELAAARQQHATHHRHTYPLEGPDAIPGPCQCGKAFPWTEITPDDTEPEPSTEPWRDLFGRIRAELGLTSDRTDT